jgi:hypothetical protein
MPVTHILKKDDTQFASSCNKGHKISLAFVPNTFRLSLKTGKLRVVPENQQLNATQKIFVGRTLN